jgi:hypothetical protein
VLCMSSDGTRKASLAAMAGAFASFAAWTKNEGLVFFGISLVCFWLVTWRWRSGKPIASQLCYPLFGAAPGLLVIGYFKAFLAPPGDIAAQPIFQVLHKLTETSRYWIIVKALIARALELGTWWAHPLVLLVILAVSLRFSIDERQKQGVILGWLTLTLLFFAYCGVYQITPLDLRFHLSSSLIRLYAQMWPCFLFLVFLILGRPEDLTMPGSVIRKSTKSSEGAV